MPPFSHVFYSLYQEVLSMHLQNRLRVTYLSSLLPPPWSEAPSSLPWIAVMLPKGALHLHCRPSPYALSISQSDPGKHIRSSLSFAQNHPGPPVSHMKASLALWPVSTLPLVWTPVPLPRSLHSSHTTFLSSRASPWALISGPLSIPLPLPGMAPPTSPPGSSTYFSRLCWAVSQAMRFAPTILFKWPWCHHSEHSRSPYLLFFSAAYHLLVYCIMYLFIILFMVCVSLL